MIPEPPKGACATCARWSGGERGRGQCAAKDEPGVMPWAFRHVYTDDGCWHGPLREPKQPCPGWESNDA